MIQPNLKKNLLISLVCHAVLFSAFTISFGIKMPVLHYPSVSFWGQILNSYDFTRPASSVQNLIENRSAAFKRLEDLLAGNPVKVLTVSQGGNRSLAPETPVIKPLLGESLLPVKQDLTPKPALASLRKRREPVITFHPLLPQHFILYFKDRQTAHIEVMFNIASAGRNVNHIMLQRKISSGNLEADLLSMRYIGHYLFIQEKRFVPDKWQTVKIDLSP